MCWERLKGAGVRRGRESAEDGKVLRRALPNVNPSKSRGRPRRTHPAAKSRVCFTTSGRDRGAQVCNIGGRNDRTRENAHAPGKSGVRGVNAFRWRERCSVGRVRQNEKVSSEQGAQMYLIPIEPVARETLWEQTPNGEQL